MWTLQYLQIFGYQIQFPHLKHLLYAFHWKTKLCQMKRCSQIETQAFHSGPCVSALQDWCFVCSEAIRISTGNIFVSVSRTRVTGVQDSEALWVMSRRSRHGLFPRESPVIKGVHVYNLFCFHDGRRLDFLFPSPLTLHRHPELLHHCTAERPLHINTQHHYILYMTTHHHV